MTQPIVKIKKLSDGATLPEYAHKGDSGCDLFADLGLTREEKEAGASIARNIQPGCRVLIKTGLAIALPEGYEAQVRSKSGLALKQGLMVLNSPGTIDTGYRSDIGVILLNTSNMVVTIVHGQKIAQLVVKPVEQAIFNLVDELDETSRGEGGFGSTGLEAK